MGSASRGGRLLAEYLVPAYIANPKIKVVIVGGSVARGCADDYSDLELGVFWSDPPSDEERLAAVRRTGGELWKLDSYKTDPERVAVEHIGLSEVTIGSQCYTGTSMISMQHLTVRAMEQWLADVLDRYDLSLEKQTLLHAVQHALPLHGEPLLRRWQTKLAHYPHELARRMVQEHLWLGYWFYPDAYAVRDDRLILYQHFCWIAQGILRVLSGLNRIYVPSSEYKWMDQWIDQMPIAPPNLAVRLRQLFQMDTRDAGRQVLQLINETLTCIEAHLPEADTARERKRWAELHPYSLMRALGSEPIDR